MAHALVSFSLANRMVRTVREVISMLEADGWYLDRQKATSHRIYRHPSKPGHVTVSGKMSADMAPGTYNNILKQAGLK